MAFDVHANFAYSAVAVAPSPATSGLSLTVATGYGAIFPSVPFNVTLWPAGTVATPTNAEIVRVTAKADDVFTIVRAQEGTTAKAIAAGYQCANTVTVKSLTDIEAGVNASLPLSGGTISGALVVAGGISGDGSALTALNATNLSSGTVPNARFPATLPAASGANLTALNATNLASGTVNNARLPATISVTNVEVATLLTLTGGQAKFPATQIASADANTLDDYEEGTWTPAMTPTSGSGITYTSRAGLYTKVGRLVIASYDMYLSALGTASGAASITGLPFAASSVGLQTGLPCVHYWSAMGTNWSAIMGHLSGSSIVLYGVAGTQATTLTSLHMSDMTALTRFIGTAIYMASA